jgi:hypothetical protein
LKEAVTAAVSGEIDGQRLKTTPHCHVGPAVSEREGGNKTYRFGLLNGPRLALALLGWTGPFRSVSPLFPFFFVLKPFSFLFLVYFISFSKLVQIDSNQFVNFSKNQLNILSQ